MRSANPATRLGTDTGTADERLTFAYAPLVVPERSGGADRFPSPLAPFGVNELPSFGYVRAVKEAEEK
jgi:hypothetical protein